MAVTLATITGPAFGCSDDQRSPASGANPSAPIPAGDSATESATESADESAVESGAGSPTESATESAVESGLSAGAVAQAPASPTATPSSTAPAVPGPFELLGHRLPDTVPDGRALGQLIATTEAGIRDPATTEPDLAAWGALQQRSYRLLRQHPEWIEEAVTQVPEGRLRDAVQRNALAGAHLSATTPTQTELPDWVIVAPVPPEELLAMYHEAAERFGIPWGYLAAINLIETRMGRIRGLSTAGAQGPMQFLPSTWAEFGLGGDIDDPRDAIHAAANYLAARGGPDNMDRAIFAYNRSNAYVLAVTMYARTMLEDERAFLGYWHWQVYYRTVDGDVLLPEGWTRP